MHFVEGEVVTTCANVLEEPEGSLHLLYGNKVENRSVEFILDIKLIIKLIHINAHDHDQDDKEGEMQ